MQEYNQLLIELHFEGEKIDDTRELINQCMILPVDKLFTSKVRLMSPYYLVGELMFCLSVSRDLEFISHYSKYWENISDNGKTVRSAYFWQAKKGHGFNQVEDVVKKLKANKNSRQAIIHLHHANYKPTKDEICTLTLQFLIRNNKLIMIVNMRSNDVILGLPYDHAMFILLGNIIADKLGITLGNYYHNVGSLHKYNRHKMNFFRKDEACDYNISFSSEFFKEVSKLVCFEEKIRKNEINIQEQLKFIDCLSDNLTVAFGMTLMMYNQTAEIKRFIFNRINKRCQKGLTQLLSDYENFGG